MADAPPTSIRPAPGDYLQSNYQLWLVGHQLEHARAPWLDPYSFQPEVSARVNFAGWPLGVPYWPLRALFDPLVAWNLIVLLSFVAAGLATFGWLRELGLARGAALVGGLAFALAPYRVEQSAGHLLGIVAILLPLALWAFERGRRRGWGWFVVAAAAVASIPLSGQVHLALGAVPFFVVYAVIRTRERLALLAAVATVVLAGLAGFLVRHFAIEGSIEHGGRSLAEVRRYSAPFSNFFDRASPHAHEKFVYLGWATLVLAALGVAALLVRRRYGIAVVLLVGAVVPALLALGTHFPLYSRLWHGFVPFRYPRVPERLLPIACLCLAALVAYALSFVRSSVVAPLLVGALLAVDLHVPIFSPLPGDPDNAAYAVLESRPPGRLLELPVFLPNRHEGSVYLLYELQAQRERPAGYSTLAPVEADRTARRLRPLNCGDWTVHPQAVRRLGVRYVALHQELYAQDTLLGETCLPLADLGLRHHGFRVLGSGKSFVLYERT